MSKFENLCYIHKFVRKLFSIRPFRPSGISPKSGGFGKLKTIKASLSREVAAIRLTEGFFIVFKFTTCR